MPIIEETSPWSSVAVPLAQGLDINTRARLTDPAKLIVADNVYFPQNGGPEKRKGHSVTPVKSGQEAGFAPENWLYGWGRFDDTDVYGTGPLNLPGGISEWPHAGVLKGVAKRDNEVVAWDGYNLYSKTGNTFNKFTAQFPTVRTEAFGKSQQSQSYADCADNGVIRVLAYRDLDAAVVVIKVYDSITGALRFETQYSGDQEYLRVVPTDAWVQVFISDITSNVIKHLTIHQDDLTAGNFVDEGVNTDAHFDVTKLPDNRLLLVYVDTSNDLRLMYFKANGTPYTLGPSANTQLDIGGANALRVGVDVHPLTGEIGLIWATSSAQRCRIYDDDGVVRSGILTFANDANNSKVAVVASYLTTEDGYGVFFGYSDNTLSTNRFIRLRGFLMTGMGLGEGGGAGITSSMAQRFNVNMIGRPFRVGNIPFIIACFPSDFQTSYTILDQELLPVGRMEYGSADNNVADPWMFSVNYNHADNLWETYDFHCAIMYQQRVLDQEGIFHEIGVKFCQMNFMPEFRRVQAGRALYFPGAQLNTYDGEQVVESGFHWAVEEPTMVASNGSGSLTNSGEYRYRIYLCWKNAAGEEVRGPALLTNQVSPFGASDDTVTITGKTIPTRKDNAYFLVYRNASAGTLWYLVSNRDPASPNCPKNDLSSATWTFTDTVSDAVAETNELDPANATGFLSYYSAPASEVIAYGKDRLWLAGGELPAGTILPSRLFYTEEIPSFHLNMAHNVDRDNDRFTAIGFLSDSLLAFKEKRAYFVLGDAADSLGQDDTLRPQLALSDTGCISHNSLVRLSSGIAFQSENGIRLVDASGLLRNIGSAVDPDVDYITDAVLDTENRLVKFYQTSNTLVYDYEGGQWTKWTCGAKSGFEDYLIISSDLWQTNDTYTDGDIDYIYRIQTAPLSLQLGNFNRIRKVRGYGKADEHYTISMRVFMDEEEVPTDSWSFDSTTQLNTSTWGSDSWGTGLWGDTSTAVLYPREGQWKWRRRLAKQKCSCISLEIVYNGSDKGPVHTFLVFEVAKKSGLDK